MKSLFLSVLLTIGSLAGASEPKDTKKIETAELSKRLGLKFSFAPKKEVLDSVPLQPELPTRYAFARGEIVKHTFDTVKGEYLQEQVCQINDFVPVYDLRNSSNRKYILGTKLSCASNLGNDLYTIQGILAVGLLQVKVLSFEQPRDLKFFMGYAAAVGQKSVIDIGESNSINEDVNLKSSILIMRPKVFVTCIQNSDSAGNSTPSNCVTDTPVFFTVVADIND